MNLYLLKQRHFPHAHFFVIGVNICALVYSFLRERQSLILMRDTVVRLTETDADVLFTSVRAWGKLQLIK